MLAAPSSLSSSSAAPSHVHRSKRFPRPPSFPQIIIARSLRPPRPISASCASCTAERLREKAGGYYSSPRAGDPAGALAAVGTLYEVLGLSSGATPQEIKVAFRRLARERHPDVAAAGRERASAEEFMRIHAAYATLSDPGKRAEYDRRVAAASVLRRRTPFSSSSSSSAAAAAAAAYHYYPSPPSFTSSSSSGFGRRTWETDQCW